MLSRRLFFSTLLASPIAIAFRPSKTVDLPISCDLSMTGLQGSLLLGLEHDLGRALRLVIGPENTFIARELLYSKQKPYESEGTSTTANPIYNAMGYIVTREYPRAYWHVEFERGIVRSQGAGN